MPYRTKTHPWIYLIHRLLIGKFLKYLLITQAVELICQTNSDAAVFEMHHNDFFAKTFHSGVEFYFLWRWQRTKAAKNSYYKVIDALMFGEVFDRQTCSQSVFICKDNGRCGEGTNQRSSCTMKCLIIILRFCEWFAPCILTTVKQTTKTLRILPPTFKPVSQQIRLVQVACILDSDWKKLRGSRAIRGSYVTCCKTSLPWAGKTRANCTDFLAKSRTTLYFPQPAKSWFVARQIWFVGGKTSNISIVSFHMTSQRPYWCSKTMKRRPCWCLKPILWTLNFFLMQTISFVSINLHDADHVSENALFNSFCSKTNRTFSLFVVPYLNVIRNPESGIRNPVSRTGNVFACGFGIRNSALGIWNPAKLDWNPEFEFHCQVIRSYIESLNNRCLLLNSTVWNLKGTLSLKKLKSYYYFWPTELLS